MANISDFEPVSCKQKYFVDNVNINPLELFQQYQDNGCPEVPDEDAELTIDYKRQNSVYSDGSVSDISPPGEERSQVTFDFSNATLQAVTEDNITPLLKEELKFRIMNRRMSNGEPPLPIFIFQETKEEEKITPEDEEQRKQRRIKNKAAAQKCREKKRETQTQLMKMELELQSKNTTLKYEITKLLKDKEKLEEIIKQHSECCKMEEIKRTQTQKGAKPSNRKVLPFPSRLPIKRSMTSHVSNKGTSSSHGQYSNMGPPSATYVPRVKPTKPSFYASQSVKCN